jgi:hypothetical protein
MEASAVAEAAAAGAAAVEEAAEVAMEEAAAVETAPIVSAATAAAVVEGAVAEEAAVVDGPSAVEGDGHSAVGHDESEVAENAFAENSGAAAVESAHLVDDAEVGLGDTDSVEPAAAAAGADSEHTATPEAEEGEKKKKVVKKVVIKKVCLLPCVYTFPSVQIAAAVVHCAVNRRGAAGWSGCPHCPCSGAG